MSVPSVAVVYEAIAHTLRDFGYWNTDLHMIREVHEAMLAGADLPHGLLGRLASDQIKDVGLPGASGARLVP